MHRIWDYIEILRGPHVAVSTDRKPADGDVLDTMFLQVLSSGTGSSASGIPERLGEAVGEAGQLD